MSLINREMLSFTANAYDPKTNEFFEISDKTYKVHGSSFVSTQQTFHSKIYKDNMTNYKN